MFNLINKIPLPILAFIAVFMAVAPFGFEPHLLAKTKMLLAGTLVKPLDIFDLVMHAAPMILLAIMLIRKAKTQ